MRSLVTGVDGFIGGWLASALVAAGDDVHGMSRRSTASTVGDERHLCDITDGVAVNRLVEEIRPDRVFHLAALSNIPASFGAPLETMRVNVEGSLNLLEAVKASAPAARVVSVGSSSEYGTAAERIEPKLREDMELSPSSPYAASKATQGMFARIYAATYGLPALHVRPFAVIGPGKEGDALSDFCKAVVEIERGRQHELRVGNLDSVRDFIDVRDCVRALILVSTAGSPGVVYNVCSGHGEALRDLLTLLTSAAKCPVIVVEADERQRRSDDLRLVGDCGRLTGLGYAPSYSIVDTVHATLDHWRACAG